MPAMRRSNIGDSIFSVCSHARPSKLNHNVLAAGQLSQAHPDANGHAGFTTQAVAHEGFSQRREDSPAAEAVWQPNTGQR